MHAVDLPALPERGFGTRGLRGFHPIFFSHHLTLLLIVLLVVCVVLLVMKYRGR